MPLRSCHPCFALPAALGLLLVLSAPAAGAAQKRGSEPDVAAEAESGPEFTVKVPVNVVLVNVTVTDKSGRFVTDLTAADFKLFEDGKRQRIQSFEIESSQPLAGPGPVDPAGAAAAETGALQPLQSSEGEPGKLISFFIDDLTERSVRFFGWVISALQEFMEEEMGPRDQVGVFSASGSVRIPFTGDRELLRDRIDELGAGKLNLLRPDRIMSDVRAIRIVEGDLKGRVSEQEQFEAWRQYNEVQASIHRLLGSLRQHLRYLQHFRGSRSLVLLSEGFVPSRPMRWRVDRMVDQALRSRVTLNAVDIKGLDTAPLSTDIVFGDFPLERLAEDTGGIFYRASNDLVAGFRQIRDAQSFYYVLSYASPDQKAGGKYHRIRVEVDRPGLELGYRRGYFTSREQLSQEDRKKEDFQLALEAPGRFDRIPLELGFRSSPLEGDRHRLSVFTKVNVAAIPFQHQEGRRTNLLNLVVAVYDEKGSHRYCSVQPGVNRAGRQCPPFRRALSLRLIEVVEIAEAVPGLVRAGRPRSREVVIPGHPLFDVHAADFLTAGARHRTMEGKSFASSPSAVKTMPFRSCHPSFAFPAVLCLLLALPVPAAAGAAQKRGSESGTAGEADSGSEFTITVPVNVVPVKVTVTDKSGQFVTDLVAADFKLFEDGKRQRIQSFEIESGQPPVSSEAVDPAGTAAAETPALQPLQGSGGEPGRLISYFIDDLTERSPEFFGWAVSALKKFVAEEMGPQDRVGVFSASGGVTIPFSGNREFLRGKVQELNVGKLDLARPYRGGGVKQPDEVRLTDLQAIRIVEGGHAGWDSRKIRAEAYRQYEETQAAAHRLLAGLALHLRYLRHFRASKALVLLSEGFVLGKRTRWRLDQVIDRALRSRVLFHVVDIRGLHTVGFEASSDEPPVVPEFVAGRSIGRNLSALYLDQVYQSRPLEKVTEETGGTYFRDSNDLLAGLKQVTDARPHYYVLSYASPDQKASGKFHRIRVEASRPGLELSYRRGYYAPREKLSPEDRKNEDIRIALAAPDDFDQIPLELTHESSQAEENRCRVSFFTHIKIYGMPFQRQGKRRRNLVHLVVTVYDENGEQVEVAEQTVQLNLSESSYRSMLQRGFIARTEVEVPAGQYTVKAVVRESSQARMGSLQRAVRISVPEDGAENRGLAALSRARPVPPAGLESGPLVLSQQLTPLADLSAGQQQGLLASGDPLIFRDVRIHPVAADPIDRRQPVTFYYRLHNLQHPGESREMTARVQLTDESGRVSRFPLIALEEGMTQSWGQGRVAVVFNLSFKSVQPGKYRLTVMTRAPAAGGQSVIARSAMTVAE